jgi:6-pyruvoyl-tetrahydropterin synthase
VEGTPGDDGMIIDFDDLTKAVRPLIRELDHAFLCQDQDTILAEFLVAHDMKRKIVPFPSTVENIATLFADRLEPVFREVERVTAFAVTISETETSSARIDRPLVRS